MFTDSSSKLMCKISLFLLLLITIFYNPHYANAGRTVRVGVYETKPLAYSDKDGSAHGFFVDMLNRIAEKEQWNMQYVPGTWQEGLDRLKSDKIDMVLCIAYTEAREKYMDFPKEFLLLDWGLIFKPKGSQITSLLDLEGKRVSALKGDVYLTGFRELVRQFNVNVRILEVDQYPDVFKTVESGEVAAGVNGNLYGMLNETDLSLEQTAIIFSPVKLGYAVNEGKNGDLISALDRHIAEMKADKTSIYHNELEQLMSKKGTVIPKEAYWAASGVILALILAIAFIFVLRSEVKRKTQTIRESAERYQLLSNEQQVILNNSPVGVCMLKDRKVVWANPFFDSLYGYEIGTTKGLDTSLLNQGNNSYDDEGKAYAIIKKGETFKADALMKKKDGTSFWTSLIGHAINPAKLEEGSIWSVKDITERKRAEEMLKQSEEKYRNLFNNAEVAIFRSKLDGSEIIDANQKFLDLLGKSREETVGKPSQILWADPQEREEMVQRLLAVGRVTGYEFKVLDRQGNIRNCISSILLYPEQEILEGSILDITDLKQAVEERINLEKQLLHAQKLESLGVLAGGIAHDFNNILTSIVGNADLALMRINKESPVINNLHAIEQASARASDLAKQMLAYSGKGKFVIENLDLGILIEEMLHMLEVSISKKVDLRLNLSPDIPSVEADATQIRQIIMNLVINASEAIGDSSGFINIATSYMECNRSYLNNFWQNEKLSEGLYVCLEISDTGCGMDNETIKKIFDPFFTTKFTGRGLGMAAVHGIVRGHKGAINVYSETNKGTSFKILLPVSDGPARIYTKGTHHDEWKGEGVILLVDDEETVLSIGSEMLKELGFETITAEDGRQALEQFKKNPGVEFVILDLTMPNIDGEQCFQELRKIKPDVKVIMSSGYSEHEVTLKFAGKGLAGFIQKPYKLSALKEVIRLII